MSYPLLCCSNCCKAVEVLHPGDVITAVRDEGRIAYSTHRGDFCSMTCYLEWAARIESVLGPDVRTKSTEQVT